jgi:hypothetical protein
MLDRYNITWLKEGKIIVLKQRKISFNKSKWDLKLHKWNISVIFIKLVSFLNLKHARCAKCNLVVLIFCFLPSCGGMRLYMWNCGLWWTQSPSLEWQRERMCSTDGMPLDRVVPKYSENGLSQCRFFHHKSHKDCSEKRTWVSGVRTAWPVVRPLIVYFSL